MDKAVEAMRILKEFFSSIYKAKNKKEWKSLCLKLSEAQSIYLDNVEMLVECFDNHLVVHSPIPEWK